MIHPTKSKVLVQLHNRKDRSKSGLIFIPRQAQETPFTATVVAVGPRQQDVKSGDTVVISNYAGVEFEHENQEYIMLDSSEIMARIEDRVEFEHTIGKHCWQEISVIRYYECICGACTRVEEKSDDRRAV